MIQLLLHKMSKTVNFKESVTAGDLIITNCANHPLYAIVDDIKANKQKKEPGEWWDIDLYLLFIPPVKRTITLSTKQMAGKERWEVNGFEHAFAALDLSSIGSKKPQLRLVKN